MTVVEVCCENGNWKRLPFAELKTGMIFRQTVVPSGTPGIKVRRRRALGDAYRTALGKWAIRSESIPWSEVERAVLSPGSGGVWGMHEYVPGSRLRPEGGGWVEEIRDFFTRYRDGRR